LGRPYQHPIQVDETKKRFTASDEENVTAYNEIGTYELQRKPLVA
jgi:hypothetical protein